MDLKVIVADYLRKSADAIETNTCGMSNEEILQLASSIMHQELNKNEAAEFLNMSTRTFDRRVESGELPKGVHQSGSKQLIWYKDELLTNEKNQ